MKKIAALLIAASLIISCGGEEPSEAEGTASFGPDTLILAVTDTIGVLYGDSTCEFGAITDAEFDPMGRLLVLDGIKARLSVFSPEGEWIRTVGRMGPGPGEFQYPRCFAQLTDGRLLVSDWSGATLTFFDDDLEFEDQITGFNPTPPMDVVPGVNGTILGGNIWIVARESYDGESYIGRWSDGIDPDLIYIEYPLFIEVVGYGEDVDVNVNVSELVFDSDATGNIFIALRCDSIYNVTGYNPDGEIFLSIEKDWERVERTEDELAEIVYNESMSRGDAGTSVNRSEDLDPYLYHDAIEFVLIDDMGRIWIKQGYTSMPTFEIYDQTGELLHVAVIPELDGLTGVGYCFHNGLLAYDFAPIDYPKVYLLGVLQD